MGSKTGRPQACADREYPHHRPSLLILEAI